MSFLFIFLFVSFWEITYFTFFFWKQIFVIIAELLFWKILYTFQGIRPLKTLTGLSQEQKLSFSTAKWGFFGGIMHERLTAPARGKSQEVGGKWQVQVPQDALAGRPHSPPLSHI